ncbi:MAG: cell division protein, partial [Sulfolobaceae archaeon]
LGELKDQIKGVAPEVALALDSITSSVNSIAIETGAISERSVVPAMVDEQAKQILDEAQKMAEVKVREILPELPHPPTELPKPRAQAIQIKRQLTEDMLLDYIRSTGGFLDLEYISKNYGVDKVEVLNLLKRLEQKGLIALEG